MLLGAQQIANFFQSQPASPASQQQQQPAGAPRPKERRASNDDIVGPRALWQRHATRSRTRTRSRVHLRGAYERSSHATSSRSRPLPDDHPLTAQNLAKRGYHTFQCLRVPFHVKKRYTFKRELGIGAYGCVALAYDAETHQDVAIKKVANVFGRELLTRRALREVTSLHYLRGCHNVSELLEFDTSFIEFSEIYLVLKASDADLSQIIRSNQTLTEAHIKYFMVQLLRAIHYMHSVHLLHRDLKPGNLLVNADCSLRVCDFGMARAFACPASAHNELRKEKAPMERTGSDESDLGVAHPSGELLDAVPESGGGSSPETLDIGGSRAPSPCGASSRPHSSHFQLHASGEDEGLKRIDTSGPIQFPGGPLTEYVSTRWYRAPEVMLCFQNGYGPPMDMWSVGCIFAELLNGKPLFPGKDYIDQLALIRQVLGAPSEQVIERIGSPKAKEHMQSLPLCSKVPWKTVLPNTPEPALDLLARLLHWDPSKRISAGEALAHPWLARYRDASFAIKMPEPFNRFDEVEMIRTPSEFKDALERESAIIDHERGPRAISSWDDGQTDSSQVMVSPASKQEWTSHTRSGSPRSESTMDTHKGLGMHTYDWTPPSSFDSEPGTPVHTGKLEMTSDRHDDPFEA